MKYILLVLVLLGVGILGIMIFLSAKPPSSLPHVSPTAASKETTMTITSSAFQNNTSIPQKYTCEGESISPPLSFNEVPSETKSLVLLMDDPDVPKTLKPDGMFDHWVVFNIPPTTTEVAEGAAPSGIQGRNGAGESKYTGPCPPDREHRYFFKLYALDSMLPLNETATKKDVENAMNGHVVAQAELIGLYDKKNK